jgi:hypothetical protein
MCYNRRCVATGDELQQVNVSFFGYYRQVFYNIYLLVLQRSKHGYVIFDVQPRVCDLIELTNQGNVAMRKKN